MKQYESQKTASIDDPELLVNLSDASPFHKKRWNIHKNTVPGEVTQHSPDCYLLSGSFVKSFERYRQEFRLDPSRNDHYKTEADVAADALCFAAIEIERIGVEDAESLQDAPIWSGPVSDAWKDLGSDPIPFPYSITLERTNGQSNWRMRDALGLESSKVRLQVYFGNDKAMLPRLTIKVEGSLVCLLMTEGTSTAKTKLWQAIEHWSAVHLGLAERRRGRRMTNLGYYAAKLKDHEGLTWSQVARQLCPEKHDKHGPSCAENCRKQAAHYYKCLRNRHSPSVPRQESNRSF